MYDDDASGDGQQQQASDPQRQVFPGYTNQRINDALADAPFLDDDMMDGGGGGEDVIMEEASKTPEASSSPKNSGDAERSPEIQSSGVMDVNMTSKDARKVMERNSKTLESEDDDEDEKPLAPTQLGISVDSIMMHWCQLLTNVTVKPPVPPPSTLDHVKEVAEVCSKHFRDSSVDVNNEVTRLGVQWEMQETEKQSAVEMANLDEAIKRQSILRQLACDIMRKRIEAYAKECPNAGKHFNT